MTSAFIVIFHTLVMTPRSTPDPCQHPRRHRAEARRNVALSGVRFGNPKSLETLRKNDSHAGSGFPPSSSVNAEAIRSQIKEANDPGIVLDDKVILGFSAPGTTWHSARRYQAHPMVYGLNRD